MITLRDTGDPVPSSEVDDLMPSLTLRYDVTDDFRLRFNYGETLRRPAFVDLNPNFTLTEDLTNIGYGTGTGGNPDLEAAKAKNIDLTVEWYFADDSAIYGTWFSREIDGLVVPLRADAHHPGHGPQHRQFKVTRPVNASDGEIDGIELGFLYFPAICQASSTAWACRAASRSSTPSQNIPRDSASEASSARTPRSSSASRTPRTT